ncbi:MAG: right-handed parallel beta-helix repeat-containing protein [Opitutales bacterium]|nr:right-handed parallel beta-helix repeat-containing protein [Opitutales bacterium]
MKLRYTNLMTLWVLALSMLVPKMWAADHFDVEVYLDDDVWTIAAADGTILGADSSWDFVDAVNQSFTHLTPDRTEKETVIVRDDGVIPPHNSTPLRAIQIPSFTTMDFQGVVRVEDTGEPLTAPLRATWAESIEIINFHLEGNPRYGIWFRAVKDIHFHNIHMDLTGGLAIRIDDGRGQEGSDPGGIHLDGRSNDITVDYAYIRGSGGHGFETYGVDGLTVGTIETVDTGYAGVLLNLTRNATIDRVYAINAGSGTGYAGFRTANTNGPNIHVGEVIVRGGGRGIFSVSNSGGVTVDWIDIEGMESHGILLEDAQDWHIKGGIIRNTGAQGIRVTSTANHWNSQNNIIENVVVRETQSPSRMSHGLQETGSGTENNQYLNLDLRNSGGVEMAVLSGTDTTGTVTSADPAPTANAEVYLDSGDWVFVNNDTSVDGNFGGDMVAAVQAAIDSLTAERTLKERVVIRDSGTIGPNLSSEIAGIVVDSYTTLDFEGTLTVADEGDPTIIPIIIEEVYQVEIENLHVVGNARHGVWIHGSKGVVLGNITLELEAVSEGGSGIRIESSEDVQTENVRLVAGMISGTSSHGIELYGVQNVVMDAVVTENTGGAGILADGSQHIWVTHFESENAGAYGALAAFNTYRIRSNSMTVDGGVRGLLAAEGSWDIRIESLSVAGVDNQGVLIEDSGLVRINGGEIRNSGAEGILLSSNDSASYGSVSRNHVEFMTITDDRDSRQQTYGIREVGEDVNNNIFFRNDLRNGGTVADIELIGEDSSSIQNAVTGGEEPGQYDAEVYRYQNNWVAERNGDFIYWGGSFITAVNNAIESFDPERTEKVSVVVWDAGTIEAQPAGNAYVGIRLPSYTILDVREPITVEDDIGIIVPVLIEEATDVEVWNLDVRGTARNGIWVRSSSNIELENVHVELQDLDESDIIYIPPFEILTTADGNGADTTLTNDSQSGNWGPNAVRGGESRLTHRVLNNSRMKIPMIRFDISHLEGEDFDEAMIALEIAWGENRTRDWAIWGLTDPDLQDWDESTTSYNSFDGVLPANLGNYELDAEKWVNLGSIQVAGAAQVYTSTPTQANIASYLESVANGSGLATFLLITPSDNNANWDVFSKEGAGPSNIPPTLLLPNIIAADWAPGDVGQGILVDDSLGERSSNITMHNVHIHRAMLDGISLLGVDGFEIDSLQSMGSQRSALYVNDSHDGLIDGLAANGGQHGLHAVGSSDIEAYGLNIEGTSAEAVLIEDSQGIEVLSGEILNAGIAGVHIVSTGDDGTSPATGNRISGVKISDDRESPEQEWGVRESGAGSDNNLVTGNDLRNSGTTAEVELVGENSLAYDNWLTGMPEEGLGADLFVSFDGEEWLIIGDGAVLDSEDTLVAAVTTAFGYLTPDRSQIESITVQDAGAIGPNTTGSDFYGIEVPSYTALTFAGTITVEDDDNTVVPLWLNGVQHVQIWKLDLAGSARTGVWIQSSQLVHLGQIDMDLVEVEAYAAITTADGNGADTYLGNDSDWSRGSPSIAFGELDTVRMLDAVGSRIRLPMIRFDISDLDSDSLVDARVSLNITWRAGRDRTWTVYGLIDESLADWDESTTTFENFDGITGTLATNEVGGTYDAPDSSKWVELGEFSVEGEGLQTSDPETLNLDQFLADNVGGTITLLFTEPGNDDTSASWDFEPKEAEEGNPPTLWVRAAAPEVSGYGVRVDGGEGTRSAHISMDSVSVSGASNHGVAIYETDRFQLNEVHTAETGGGGLVISHSVSGRVGLLHARGGAAGLYINESYDIAVAEVDIADTEYFGILVEDSQDIRLNGGLVRNTNGVGIDVSSSGEEGTTASTNVTVRGFRVVDDREDPQQTYGIREYGRATGDNLYLENDLRNAGSVADLSISSSSAEYGNTLTPPPAFDPSDPTTWFGYAVDDHQRVDAGPMGRFFVGNRPWVYSYSWGRYLYVNEELDTPTGLWFFMPNIGQ